MRLCYRRNLALLILLAAACAFAGFLAVPTIAQERPAAAFAECKHDIWLIDTHCLGDNECDLSKARFLRLNGHCQWVKESEESFLATLDPEKLLNIMLPGYLTPIKLAVEHQWTLYQQLEIQAKCRGLDCAPTRLVMYTWPSEADGIKLVQIGREKAVRADIEGYWLAGLLAKFPKDYRVNLVAYSLGARIATSAAHHLAGGERCGCPSVASSSARLSGVLIAAAVDADWLDSCEPHSLALDRFEKLLLINNCKDRVLRFYKLIDQSKSREALGAVGLLLPYAKDSAHVQQWEVSHIIGRNHNWYRYIGAPEIMSAIAEYAFYRN
jgi:hypothetical protein